MSLYKSLKTKSPQFLNSASARSLEASFLFTGLKSNNQGSTNHFRLGVSWNMIALAKSSNSILKL